MSKVDPERKRKERPPTVWHGDLLDRALTLRRQGLNATIIARELGPSITPGMVRSVVFRMQRTEDIPKLRPGRPRRVEPGAELNALRAARRRVRREMKERQKERLEPPAPAREASAPAPAPRAKPAPAAPVAPEHEHLPLVRWTMGPDGLVDTGLRRGMCRFPMSGAGADTLFCAAPAPTEESYCAHHRRKIGGGK